MMKYIWRYIFFSSEPMHNTCTLPAYETHR